jgi:hypothetical protein
MAISSRATPEPKQIGSTLPMTALLLSRKLFQLGMVPILFTDQARHHYESYLKVSTSDSKIDCATR